MERTQTKCGIVIPAYVNLNIYEFGFYTTISFHVSEEIAQILSGYCKKYKIPNGKVFVFSKRNSNGQKLHYLSVERHYVDLNKIHYACYNVAHYDKLRMMQLMREAKAYKLQNEIFSLQIDIEYKILTDYEESI